MMTVLTIMDAEAPLEKGLLDHRIRILSAVNPLSTRSAIAPALYLSADVRNRWRRRHR